MKFVKDQRGAVLAEFAVVAMPLFATFFGFVQLAQYATADLYVRHAANVAARAAAVMSEAHNPGTHSPMNDGTLKAATIALGTWADPIKLGNSNVRLKDVGVDINDPGGAEGMTSVTVNATYVCKIPLGKLLVCGADGKRTVSHTARFPKQGARYL